MIDISSLLNKIENRGATSQGKLSAEEWNLLVSALIECQGLEMSLESKIGYIRLVTGSDGASSVVAGFATEAKYELWDALGDDDKWGAAGEAYLLSYLVLPHEGADAYTVRLFLRETPDVIQADANVTLHVRGTSVVSYADGGTDNVAEVLTIRVQTRTSVGAGWVTRGEFYIPSNEQTYTDIPLADYLVSGTNYVQVQARGAQASSIWTGMTLNVVNLSLTPNTAFQIPMTGTTSLTLNYLYSGAVAKLIQFEFGHGVGSEFVADYSYLNSDLGCSRDLGTAINVQTGADFVFSDATMVADLLTDGTHTVRARLYVSESVTTPWIESQYMVDNALASPVVVVNNIATGLNNWTDVIFFRWAAALAGLDELSVVFRLVDSADSTVEYARWSQVAVANTEYALSTQLGLEIADSSITNIYAYMLIEDENGNELSDPIFFDIGNDASNNPTAGADFILAPASRSNAEANPKTIINAATGATIASTWTGFGMTTDGWMEVNKNVNDATQGTVRALHVPAGRYLTFEYDPLVNFRSGNSTGRSMTLEMDIRTDNILDDTDPIIDICTIWPIGDNEPFGIRLLPKEIYMMTQNKRAREDQNATWAESERVHIAVNIVYGVSGLNWVRIFLDGRIERVFNYDVNDNFAGGVVNIKIGNTTSDIDIFGMRCYQKALSTDDVMQDRKASMSSVAEKIAFATRNNILGDNGEIDFAKASALYNVIGLTGHLAKYGDENKGKTKGNKFYVSKPDEPQNAGTYTAIENSGQGTTAMTYNDWNQQQKTTDDTTFISEATETESATSSIYVAAGEPRAKKTNGKINFASSMQGHKMGLCRVYSEVFKLLMSQGIMSTPGQLALYPNARLAVYEEPYLFFHRETESDPWVFKYQMTWGAGKGDKPTFGFDKNATPHMLMVEGADNDRELANFRIPWNEDVAYDMGEEAWMYNGAKHINFGFGKTAHSIPDDDDSPEYPSDGDAINAIIEFFNFNYLHHRSVEYYAGTLTQLRADENVDQTRFYWTTQADSNLGTAVYDLFRWSPLDNTWVAAGITKLGTASYSTLNIRTQYVEFGGTASWTLGQWATINSQFIAQRTSHFKANASAYMHVDDALYHDCFVLFFAATDNRAKNTYYYTDPETLKVRWMQDDLDTVLKTNNVGQNRKPYYVELHDKNDANEFYWQGEDNGFYNLLEAAYETEKTTMMSNMLSAMATLGGSAFDYLTSRVLQAQQYYPEIAYNEVTRLVYMQAQVDKNAGRYDHNTDPVTQACGSQYWSEYDWLKDRLMYISSWCEFGEFASATSTSGSFFFRGTTGTYSFVLTPGKWMYPRVASGSSNMPPSASGRVRVQAGESFPYQSFNVTGDSTVTIRGINYYLDIGDMNVPFSSGQQLTIPGKMLQRFTFNPTGGPTLAQAQSVTVSGARNIKELVIRGLSSASGELNISECTRLESIDIRGSGFTTVRLPASEALETIHFNDKLIALTIDAQPGLTTVDFEGVNVLSSVSIDQAKAGTFDTGLLAQNIYIARDGQPLDSARFVNIAWENVSADMLMYYATSSSVTMTGEIDMLDPDTRFLTFAEVQTLVDRFGNIRTVGNDLFINYPLRTISGFNIKGVKYIKNTGTFDEWRLNILPSAGNNVAIVNGREAVSWEFTGANASQAANYATFTDTVRGVLNVTQLSDPALDLTFSIRVTMTLVNGTVLTYDKKVGFYNRIPKLGDFAYFDGTFDDEFDESKTLVGAVVSAKKVSDNEYDYEIWAKENVTLKSTNGTINTTSPQWGIYPDSAGTNGFPTAITSAIESACSLTSATDTPVVNTTTSGIPNAAGTATNYSYIDGSFLDPSKDDGYAEILPTGSAARFDGKTDTSLIVGHARTIIVGYLMEQYPNIEAIKVPTTLTELADAMAAIQAANASATNPNRYWQMFFPAAFSTTLYEPSVAEGEALDPQYAKGNWYLPAEGLLDRIYNFYLNSCGRVTYANGGRLDVSYANESPESEAVTPLFANLLKRIRAKTATNPFAFPTSSNYWSSTEGNSPYAWLVYFHSGSTGYYSKYGTNGVVRAAAAFKFYL